MFIVFFLVTLLAPVPIALYTPGYYVGLEPATVRLRITLDPHPDNRVLCLVYDGTGDAGSSCWEVDGTSPRTSWRELRGLSAGEYQVSARVARVGGKVYAASTGFVVSSRRG